MNPERLTEIDALAAWRETDTPTAHALRAALQEVRAALDEATTRAESLRVAFSAEHEVDHREIRSLVAEADSHKAQARTLADALEQIASVSCEIACASLPSHARCPSCIARAALDEYEAKP